MTSDEPFALALKLAESKYANAELVLLSGSCARGEATSSSDLDLVVLTQADPEAPYRSSYYFQDWPVEAFVHTEASLRDFFAQDIQRRRPSLPQMCAEGQILIDTGCAQAIQEEAQALLAAGPAPLSEAESRALRYQLTDLLMDLEARPTERELRFFISAQLIPRAVDALMAHWGRWSGAGKWSWRVLQEQAPERAETLKRALEALEEGELEPLISWGDAVVSEIGGRLFDGYHLRA